MISIIAKKKNLEIIKNAVGEQAGLTLLLTVDKNGKLASDEIYVFLDDLIGTSSQKIAIIDATENIFEGEEEKIIDAIKKLKRLSNIKIVILTDKENEDALIWNLLSTADVRNLIISKNDEDLTEQKTLEGIENEIDFATRLRFETEAEITTGTQAKVKIIKETEIKERVVTVTEEKIRGTVYIALIGTMPRVGVTHHAIALATMLSSKNSVAVIDVSEGGKNTYSDIAGVYGVDVKNVEDGSTFNLQGIDYFENVSVPQVSTFLNFEYIVLDFGTYNPDTGIPDEFLRANVKVVISGSKPWEFLPLEVFLAQNKGVAKKVNYIFNLCKSDSDIFKQIEKGLSQYKIHAAEAFYSVDEPSSHILNMYKDVMDGYIADRSKNKKGLFRR